MRRRERLVTPMGLVALVLAVVAVLVIIFPGAGLRERLLQRTDQPEIAAVLLQSFIRREPDDIALRMAALENSAARGDYGATREALNALKAKAGTTRALMLLEYRLLVQESGSDPQALARLRQELRRLAALQWDPDELLVLAREAERIGDPVMASALYARLAQAEPAALERWIGEAVRTGLGSGNYVAAADACFAVLDRVADPARKRQLFIKGINALRSGGQLQRALEAADRYGPAFAEDDEVLEALVRLAREANDTARAQRYVRQLMRMSTQHPGVRWLARVLDLLVADAVAAEPERPRTGATVRMRAFDPAKYTLAYEVFVGSGNLTDAFRVASEAVRQVPDDIEWRLRLAQAAEWSAQPAVALDQWHYLAQKARTPAERETAWQAVLRLAPGLQNDALLLAAWLHAADTQPMDAVRWRNLAQAYERAGRAAEVPDDFARRYAKQPAEPLLEIRAEYLEGLGRDDEAMAAYRELLEKYGANASRVLRLSILQLRHGYVRDSYAVLHRYRDRVGTAEAYYWELFADLAWLLNEDAAAREGYAVVNAGTKADATAVSRLVELTRERDPGGAARLAALGFQRLRTPALLIRAAELYAEANEQKGLAALWNSLTPQDEERFARDGYIQVLQAQYHVTAGRKADAERYYRRALAADPANVDYLAALLWHLIDARENKSLVRELRQHEARARLEPGLWEPYAAGYVTLSEPRRALTYYRRLADTRSNDYLWLVNYADVLEQAGDGAMALRVRRHAWTVVRERPVDSVAAQAEVQAIARLTLIGAPGDAALSTVRRLLRQDFTEVPTAEADRRLDAGTRELVLSWALSTGQTSAAKAWLWRHYARELERPAWAQLTIALAENDTAAIDRLLAGDSTLPPADRIEAARMSGRVRVAQTLAFEAQEARPDSDNIHLQLTENMLQTANSLVYEGMSFERGVLKGVEQRITAQFWLTESLRLTVDYLQDDRLGLTAAGAGTLAGIPRRIDETGIALRWARAAAYTELRLAQRNALATHASLVLTHARPLIDRVNATFRLALDERATETNPLFLAGMRDRASVYLAYQPDSRNYVSGELWAARYHTQEGSYLGYGEGVSWEIGHRLRVEYPDWRIRATGAHQHYVADGAPDARTSALFPPGVVPSAALFLPQDFNVFGVYTTAGDTYRNRYTRALRPYLDVGPTWNSVSGNGFLFATGLATSVIGPDRLGIGFTRSKGGNAIGGYTTEAGVRYEYLFDR